MIGKAIQAAIERLQTQSSREIRQVRENAQAHNAMELVDACDRELRLRGPAEFTAEEARRAQEQSAAVQDKPLRDVIEAAFKALPARDYERRLLQVIAENPGATYGTIEKLYGKRDAALVAGHLVYDRFGFFRRFLAEEKDQSSILLRKGTAGPKREVTWALKPETIEALTAAGALANRG